MKKNKEVKKQAAVKTLAGLVPNKGFRETA
jgi:hypothetical protein